MRGVVVPSLSASGTSWVVHREGEILACSCPAYDFSARSQKRCKHTDLVLAADRVIGRCQEAHGGADAALCRACLVGLLAVAARKVKAEVKAGVKAARKRRKAKR